MTLNTNEANRLEKYTQKLTLLSTPDWISISQWKYRSKASLQASIYCSVGIETAPSWYTPRGTHIDRPTFELSSNHSRILSTTRECKSWLCSCRGLGSLKPLCAGIFVRICIVAILVVCGIAVLIVLLITLKTEK